MSTKQKDTPSPSLKAETLDDGILRLTLTGYLDADSAGGIWREAQARLERECPASVVVDTSGIEYCDTAGIGLLISIRNHQERAGRKVEILGLKEPFADLLALFKSKALQDQGSKERGRLGMVEEIGRIALDLVKDMAALIAFVGELFVALMHALFHPRRVRWREAFYIAEQVGVNALPIVALVSFLMGVVMAYQSAIPLSIFGAEIYVANMVVLSIFRELGPLMTAILLAGRSGSAFAAELGTMKIKEEIDALTTMGLDPVRFLAVTRLVAALGVTPLLTLFANLFGLVGGCVVFLLLGFPFVTYVDQILSIADLSDLFGGLAKSVVFALLVAGAGCFRGLKTGTGPSAVGASTTHAVVNGIVLIIVTDGIFSVLYFYLGI
jgi:phospholipid/cholesterol/gamma-HCH transport system permease protein